MPEKREEEEFEIIPLSPLRKLEKRIEELEMKRGISSEEFLKEIVDIIKMNQSLIEEMAKSNDSLKLEIAKLPPRIDALLNSINELITYIKASAVEEVAVPQVSSTDPLIAKLNEIVEGNKKLIELNQTMVAALEELDKKIRRSLPTIPLRRPMIPPVPPK
jgi:uncharacterized coiled-coil protein SlyX